MFNWTVVFSYVTGESQQQLRLLLESLCGVVSNVVDSDIVVKKFQIQSHLLPSLLD